MTYLARAQDLLDARADDMVFAVAETTAEETPTQAPAANLPDATLNQIINKMRHGRGNKWIKHNVTNPAGESPNLDQIQQIRELWAAEVAERSGA